MHSDRQHRDVLKVMELNRNFFERQHDDVEQMHSSVKELLRLQEGSRS
jgi:hypothetical protein